MFILKTMCTVFLRFPCWTTCYLETVCRLTGVFSRFMGVSEANVAKQYTPFTDWTWPWAKPTNMVWHIVQKSGTISCLLNIARCGVRPWRRRSALCQSLSCCHYFRWINILIWTTSPWTPSSPPSPPANATNFYPSSMTKSSQSSPLPSHHQYHQLLTVLWSCTPPTQARTEKTWSWPQHPQQLPAHLQPPLPVKSPWESCRITTQVPPQSS